MPNNELEKRLGIKVSDEKLKLNKRLPYIKLPNEKVNLFIDWYNQDLRTIKDIPRVFEEGYIEIALKENGTKKMDKEASICSYFLSSSPDNANYASNVYVKFEMKNTNNIIDITKNQNYPVHIMKGNATVKIKNKEYT